MQINSYEWRSHPSGTSSKVNSSLISLANQFKTRYQDRILKMTDDLNIHPSNASVIIVEVANELFSEGVTWPKIVALFVLAGEMALICHRLSGAEIVKDLAERLSSYIGSNLLMWVINNGGWNGLITYQQEYDDF
ncbi:apoptosis regulator R1-like [Centruroides sculpturatus]|uniref:apoptosis regulator R1-like n=1 Tax=Centruroides sculpturatus TaxID=218467 RepID=UPI000C6CB533|nr:apoptosis regulator R1-like [Centruroides sculpturatus]